jgi:hypothetical protein
MALPNNSLERRRELMACLAANGAQTCGVHALEPKVA